MTAIPDDVASHGHPAGSDPPVAERSPSARLVAVTLDEGSIARGSPDQEHERAVAIYDMVEINSFRLTDGPEGPYALRLGIVENKLAVDVRTPEGGDIVTHFLSLGPLRGIIRDYEMVCDSYYKAIRTASPTQIEAIDMGRRGLHNEASEILMQRLDGKVAIDFDTARRLFTLIFALRWRG